MCFILTYLNWVDHKSLHSQWNNFWKHSEEQNNLKNVRGKTDDNLSAHFPLLHWIAPLMYCDPGNIGDYAFSHLPIRYCSRQYFYLITLLTRRGLCLCVHLHNFDKWFTRCFTLLYLPSLRSERVNFYKSSVCVCFFFLQ